jgi:hypothetical protein
MTDSASHQRPVVHELTIFPVGSSSPSVDDDIPDSSSFAFQVLALIGFRNEGGERFDCFACSPGWLAANFTAVNPTTNRRILPWTSPGLTRGMLFASGFLLMSHWSRRDLLESISEICDRCAGPDWPTVASRLARYLDREYEYKYDEYVDTHPDNFRLPRGWAGIRYR